MPIGIPGSLKEDHEAIHRALGRATRLPGRIGERARAVAEALHPHFEKEEATALPLLGLLRELALGTRLTGVPRAQRLAARFHGEYPRMLEEHRAFQEALDALREEASKGGKRGVVQLCRRLALHAAQEEEVFYPAALLVEKLLTSPP